MEWPVKARPRQRVERPGVLGRGRGGCTHGPVFRPRPRGLSRARRRAWTQGPQEQAGGPRGPAAAASVGIHNSNAVVDGCHLKRP